MNKLSICPICGGKVGYLLEDTKLNTDFKIKSEGLSTWTERVYMKNMFDKDISIANDSYDCYESLLIKYNKHKPITTGIAKKKTIDEIEQQVIRPMTLICTECGTVRIAISSEDLEDIKPHLNYFNDDQE